MHSFFDGHLEDEEAEVRNCSWEGRELKNYTAMTIAIVTHTEWWE